MNKIITLLLTAAFHFANAQTDSVYLASPNKSLGGFAEYELLLPQGETFVKESYTMIKGHFWLDKIDTIEKNSLQEKGKGYLEKNTKKPQFYVDYGSCDPLINEMRNSNLYFRDYHRVDSAVRAKIGFDNAEFSTFRKQNTYWQKRDEVITQTCPEDFLAPHIEFFQRQLIFIDSVYETKKYRLELVRKDPEMIDKAFVDEFLRTFNQNETDSRTFEQLVIHQPEMLIAAISGKDHSFYWKLDAFPRDVDLKTAKAILKQAKGEKSVKRKLRRKMRYKKEF